GPDKITHGLVGKFTRFFWGFWLDKIHFFSVQIMAQQGVGTACSTAAGPSVGRKSIFMKVASGRP
ncbi:hypothetical protein, partial [Rectinema subterraneum]|uniref:hypothetical protein n=1 Tax=Rectinema subterraneum TaxID=2653714 RepID=UPI001F51E63D